MSEQPHIKNGVERLRHRVEVLDGSPLMTVPPEVIREVLTRLEQAEQAVERVRTLTNELSWFANHVAIVQRYRNALDGDGRG